MSKVLTTYKRPAIRDIIKNSTSTDEIKWLANHAYDLFLKGKMTRKSYNKICDAADARDYELANKS